jgi:hypothetical protein
MKQGPLVRIVLRGYRLDQRMVVRVGQDDCLLAIILPALALVISVVTLGIRCRSWLLALADPSSLVGSTLDLPSPASAWS